MAFSTFSFIFFALKIATQGCYSEPEAYIPPQKPIEIIKLIAPK